MKGILRLSLMDMTFSPKLQRVASDTPELPADVTCSPKMPQVAKSYQTTFTDTPMLSAVAATPKTQPFSKYNFEKLHAPKKTYSDKALKNCGSLPPSSAPLLTTCSADAEQGKSYVLPMKWTSVSNHENMSEYSCPCINSFQELLIKVVEVISLK